MQVTVFLFWGTELENFVFQPAARARVDLRVDLRVDRGLGAVIPRDICETQIPFESELKGLT